MQLVREKLKVGQKVFVMRIGNAARGLKEPKITEEIISVVGNKYFKLEGFRRERFNIETMLNDGKGYISNYAVYLTMQEIQDENEYCDLQKKMMTYFDHYSSYKPTLDQLRRINSIVEENKCN